MTHLFKTGNVELGPIDLIVKGGTVVTTDAKRTIVSPSDNPKTEKVCVNGKSRPSKSTCRSL